MHVYFFSSSILLPRIFRLALVTAEQHVPYFSFMILKEPVLSKIWSFQRICPSCWGQSARWPPPSSITCGLTCWTPRSAF